MKARSDTSSAIYGLLCFLYIFSSLTLSGIPGLSILSGLAGIALVIVCLKPILDSAYFIKRWIAYPLAFVFCVAIFALVNLKISSVALVSTLISWGAAIAVGIATARKTTIKPVLYALALGSLANSVAIAIGFDTYILYQADFRLIAEEDLLKRPSGLVGNPNLAAVQALMCLFAVVIWRKHADWFLWLIGCATAVYIFVMTGSRKSIILLIFFALMIYFVSAKHRPMRLAIGLGGAILIAALLPLAFQGGLAEGTNITSIDRFIRAMQGQDTSFDERAALLIIGLEVFQESPMWGHGLDSFRHLNRYGLYAHNNFIELAVSGGVILLVVYYSVYLKISKNLLKNKSLPRQEAKAMFVFLLALLSLDAAMVTYNTRSIPLMLVLLLVHTTIDKKHRTS